MKSQKLSVIPTATSTTPSPGARVVMLPVAGGRDGVQRNDRVQDLPDSVNDESRLDLGIIARVRQGERQAFDLLVVRYQARIAALIGRYVRDRQDVLELTQDSFVKAYRGLDGFRGDSAFYTWLYRIAVNTAKNFLDASSRRPHAVMDVSDAEVLDQGRHLRDLASPERQLQRDQLKQVLDVALGQLPEELRIAFLLREFDGMSYENIAVVLDCPIGTVRSRIFRAREAIERKLAPLLEA